MNDILRVVGLTQKQTKRHKLENDKNFTIHSPEHLQLTSESSRKRQALHHDHHVEAYPAHPGPRSPGSYSHQHGLKTPVLSRGPSGDEVFRVRHERERDGSKNEIDNAGEGSSGGSGGSGMTAVVSREERNA